MQIITSKMKVPIRIDDDIITVKEGYKYVVPNHLSASFEGSPYCEAVDFYNGKEVPGPVDYTGKRIIAIRTGGFGDLMFVARSLLEIKRKFKDTYIEFATAPRFSSLVREFFYPDIVDEVSIILLPYPHYEKCDYFVSFEGFIEDNPEAYKTNAFTLIANQKFYVDIGLDHTVPLKIPIKYVEQAEEISKEWDAPVIAMQVKASAILRTYPYPYQNRLIHLLGRRGFKVLLLEKQDNLEGMLKFGAYDEEASKYILTPYSKNIQGSLGLSIALAQKSKMIVTPDSFFTYVGDSLGVPTIGIFTPVNSRYRAMGLNVYALDVVGENSCGNCQLHSYSPCHWSNDTWSPCLKAILPEYVEYSIIEILEGRK